MMLDTTLATTFEPATNIKGDVAGANWLYALPDLQLGHVVCLGCPSATSRLALARLAQSVTFLSAHQELSKSVADRHQFPHLQPVYYEPGAPLPIKDGSITLVWLVDRPQARRFLRDAQWRERIARLLTPDGLVYLERRRFVWSGSSRQLATGAAPLHLQQHLELIPPFGEVGIALPVVAGDIRRPMQDHIPYGPSRLLRLFKDIWKRVHPRGRSAVSRSRQPRRAGRVARRPGWRSRVRMWGRRLLPVIEQAVINYQPFVRREGVLLGRRAAWPAGQLPAYLNRLAGEADLDLSRCDWALAAPVDYGSRKVLFFLTDRPDDSGKRARGRYIVKMVRASALNARLANEHRALTSLQCWALVPPGTVPHPLFFGHHDGLAVLGQTMIDGDPFARRTSYRPDCPYARAAVDWLVALGATTANHEAVDPATAADTLRQLWHQFAAIYRLAPAAVSFLEHQIERLAASRHPFPVVFQHGDPGTWNVLVTPAGQVAFLDWEAAEERGMPLWDLFYFLRSFVIGSARTRGIADSLTGFERLFLDNSDFSPLLSRAVTSYCRRTGLARELVAPLFYTCWMHRALKEAARLPTSRLAEGHYLKLLCLSIERQGASTLRRLFTFENDKDDVAID